MYYYLRLHLLENRANGVGGRDVGIVVGGAWNAVVCRPEIEDGDFAS